GESLISGQSGTKITCSVKSAGGGSYNFSGTLHALTPQGETVDLNFTNGKVGPDFMGTADLSVYTSRILAEYTSTMPCQITVLNQQVKGGSIWANFSCSQVAYPPSGLCGVGLSSIVVF